MALFLIVDFYHMTDGVVFGYSPKLIDVSAIEGTASERVHFFMHGPYFLNLIVDDIVSLALVGNSLIVADTYGYVIGYLQAHIRTCC